jgi:DNA-binding FadR family transcriptional regulator
MTSTTTLRQLGRPPLGQLAAGELRERLAAGTWAVGERLPSEIELARQLGVGRSTVREAIRVLVHSGLLETRHGTGTFVVAQAAAPDWQERLRHAAPPEQAELREALELHAARLAARRRTAADLERIERALAERDRLIGARERGAPLLEADRDFHRAVVAAAHSELLEELCGACLTVLGGGSPTAAGDRVIDGPDGAHRALLDAIRAQTPKAAAKAARRIVAGTAKALRG